MQKYKKFLEKYSIKTRDDIYRLTEDGEKLINLFKINIPFNSEDIEKATKLIKVKNIVENNRQVTGITLTDATHVV
jgi:DNA-binding PadR family transcriptional regulator